ncbi:MAG: kelch repeat-containing protein [Fluviicola sp.]|nr:kelch repeat-containing protein [Fluviicola sp.]
MTKYLLFLLFACYLLTIHAQNWETKTPVPAWGRDDACAFSLLGKGYVVTGNQGGFTQSSRLWCYDPIADEWTEKTAFPGIPRQYAGSFVMNEEVYIIMGIAENGTPLNDCWKYIPKTDTWLQLADFPGQARWSMFSFATLLYGYVGTGAMPGVLLSDCWRYNPAGDTWIQLNNFPGGAVRETVSFSIAESGYVGLGFQSVNGTNLTDAFYQWNDLTKTWTVLPDFMGGPRSYATAVANSHQGFVATGQDALDNFYNDCFTFDPETVSWSIVDPLPELGMRGMSAFTIDKHPYFLTGLRQDFVRVSSVFRYNAPAIVHSDVSVYPNPSSGEAIVKGEALKQIQLLTLDGRLLREVIPTETATWLGELPAGMLLLRLQTGDEWICKRLLVY